MRAIYSYGIALVIVLVLGVWLASGTLIRGGNGPGNQGGGTPGGGGGGGTTNRPVSRS